MNPSPIMKVRDLKKRDEAVNRLLHDAEHAQSGAKFAAMMSDSASAAELKTKCDQLLAEAQGLDPGHESPWWDEHRRWLAGK